MGFCQPYTFPSTTCLDLLGKFSLFSLQQSEFKSLFSIIGNSTLRELFTLWERLLRDRCLKPYRIMPIHWQFTPSLTQSRRQLILANAPSTPQISLPSRIGHITLRCCDILAQLIFCVHPSALRRLPQWNCVLLAVKCHGVSPLSTAVRAFHRSRRPTQ